MYPRLHMILQDIESGKDPIIRMIQEYDDDKLSNPGIKSKKISEKFLNNLK